MRRNDNAAMAGCLGLIDQQIVPLQDAVNGVIAGHHHESTVRVINHQGIEVDAVLDVVLCRRGEACPNRTGHKRDACLAAGDKAHWFAQIGPVFIDAREGRVVSLHDCLL